MIATPHANPVDCEVDADMHEALYLLQDRGHSACDFATCAAGGKIYKTGETALQ